VSNADDAGLVTAVAVGVATITATSGTITDSVDFTVTPAVLDSITVAPPTANIIPGGTQAFTATGNVSDGTTTVLTATAVWTSSATAVASIAATGIATGLTVGATTITATFEGVSDTATLNVLGPSVTETLPRDTAFGIRTSTPIVVTFDQAVGTGTVTVQPDVGPCTGSLQLSDDNFANCVRFTGPVVLTAGNTIVTVTPAVGALSAATTYKLRITDAVKNAAGGAAVPFTQAAGFTTAAAGACATGLVISQVYGAGGNGSNGAASFKNDFIELHNGGSTAVNLGGFAVQYASVNGDTWQVSALPPVALAAGGYFLIQEGAGQFTATALPTPDLVPPTLIAMAGGAGKVALTASTRPLTGTCPLALTNDFVGYGAANCSEGTGPTSSLGNTTAAIRKADGCTDANDTKNDFAVATPTPRNAAAAPNVCACSLALEGDDEPAMSFLSED
jgi:hypothetical protein